MTVRQVFYQATVRGIIEKTENGYAKVRPTSAEMRATARCRMAGSPTTPAGSASRRTFNGVAEALKDTAQLYRKALWDDADSYVEIWLEKDALSGVVYPVTDVYDVPLMVARGYASLSSCTAPPKQSMTLTCRPTSIISVTSIRPASMPARRSRRRCANWRRMPRSSSSASR